MSMCMCAYMRMCLCMFTCVNVWETYSALLRAVHHTSFGMSEMCSVSLATLSPRRFKFWI